MTDTNATHWTNNKTLVYTWMLFLFPVGLYAVWTGSLFDKSMKWKITIGVILAAILLSNIDPTGLIYPFIMLPAGLYLCWKDPAIAKKTTYAFAGAAVILILYSMSGTNQNGDIFAPVGGETCAKTITQGSCTYYRDDDCNVIGQYCE